MCEGEGVGGEGGEEGEMGGRGKVRNSNETVLGITKYWRERERKLL